MSTTTSLRCAVLFLLLAGLTIAPCRAEEAAASDAALPTDLAGNEAVKKHIESFKGRGAVGDFNTKPLTVEESLKTFTVAEGFAVETILSEPQITQPLSIDFDERGRMWVVEYRQYPFPAGLKIVKYDEHLRAVFDKTPLPPGHRDHVKGADRITIHEDTDGDGKYDKHKTFIDGLNIATSVLRGRGGIWVANPPYLLFYPDANNDDIPDDKPVVHLSGFGLEDTHAVMNSLRWGPDGWIYGAQGSTCWATVLSEVTKNVHFKGQAIWRYHPETKVFEVFAEGGGNTFCVEFDSKGRCYSGTNWGNVRGLHFVQGGRYIKGWGKHGPLMNPYSFGYFEHMPHEGYMPRFSHSLIIYEGGAMPALEGKMVSIIPLHNRIQVSELIPHGSTFKTKDTIALIEAKDRWFRPVDIKAGPDGAIYIADWYDTRLTHVDPRDNWDKTHGRIYRITQKTPEKPTHSMGGFSAPDLSKLKNEELITHLKSPNKLERQTVQRILADRKDVSLQQAIQHQLKASHGQYAVELVWALHNSGGISDRAIIELLQHSQADVRRAAAQLAGENRKASRGIADYLEDRANLDTDLQVLSQIASTALRVDGGAALPTIWKLAQRKDIAADPHLPLLVWWGVEQHVSTSRESVMAVFNTAHAWQYPMVRTTLMPRLAQRFAAEPTAEHLDALAQLLEIAPDMEAKKALLGGVNAAFKSSSIAAIPPRLQRALAQAMSATSTGNADPAAIILGLRSGDAKAHAAALEYIKNDDDAIKAKRIEVIDVLGQVGKDDAVPVLLDVAKSSKWHSVRRAALAAVQRFNDPKIGDAIVAMYNNLPKDQGVRDRALDTLTKRKEWSLALLQAVEAKKIPRTDISYELMERMKLHREPGISSIIRKQWGRTRATADQKVKQIEEVRNSLAAGKGDAVKGKALFGASCALCHKLHDQGPPGGALLAPDLTGYERDNLDFMLLAIIDPSAAVREEFINYEIETKDGLLLTGFLLEQNPKSVMIQDGVEGKVIVQRDQIETLTASRTSRMPEQLLDALTADQVRDLFEYLRKK